MGREEDSTRYPERHIWPVSQVQRKKLDGAEVSAGGMREDLGPPTTALLLGKRNRLSQPEGIDCLRGLTIKTTALLCCNAPLGLEVGR